ncbi:hypothetical protein [Sphingomonas oryzagri]
MLLALILIAAVTILLCWLLFALASLALPLFVAVVAGQAAWHGGAGLFGAFAVGVIAGGATLFVGQFLLATLRGTGSRLAVALLFAAPAAVAGFSAARGIAAMGGATTAWQVVLGLIGTICVSATALARLGEAQPVRIYPVAAEGRFDA